MDNSKLPAHPIHVNGTPKNWQGLTKREYFAAMIIQGMFANSDAAKETLKQGSDPMTAFAKQAVMSADELLKQLEK